jgi:hypothetical protein
MSMYKFSMTVRTAKSTPFTFLHFDKRTSELWGAQPYYTGSFTGS